MVENAPSLEGETERTVAQFVINVLLKVRDIEINLVSNGKID